MSSKKSENFYTLDHANKFADRERPNPNRAKKQRLRNQFDLAMDDAAGALSKDEEESKSC